MMAVPSLWVAFGEVPAKEQFANVHYRRAFLLLRRNSNLSWTRVVILEQAESNWAAYVPDLPGCITTGRTLEETERNIREAIQGHLRTLREFGEPAPRLTSLAKEIEIPPAA